MVKNSTDTYRFEKMEIPTWMMSQKRYDLAVENSRNNYEGRIRIRLIPLGSRLN